MFKAICELESVTPYSQGKFFNEKKPKDITHDDFEKQTWRKRMHSTPDGKVYIPAMAFKNSLAEAAKYKSIQIPGKGKSTYTKHFESGILVVESLILDKKIDEVDGEWLHVPSDGRRGGTTRVLKCFPLIHSWSGIVEYLIFDEIITEEVFTEHLTDSGAFIGIGRFRPRQNGIYGRFKVNSVKWVKG